jgi:putative transposase
MYSRRPRLPSGSYHDGLGCLLTFCTANRSPVFGDREVVAMVGSQIMRAAMTNSVAVPAYCFMPDHLHMLAEAGSSECDLERFVKQAKQLSGFYYKQRFGSVLWQPSWHDRVLRKSDDRTAAVRYLLQNPVRAGLVTSLDDYPFIGSGTVTREALLASI